MCSVKDTQCVLQAERERTDNNANDGYNASMNDRYDMLLYHLSTHDDLTHTMNSLTTDSHLHRCATNETGFYLQISTSQI